MKTLADFKRALIVGVQLHAVHHLSYSGKRDENNQPIYEDKDMGTRPVSIVQSNSFALKTTKQVPIPSKGMTKDEQGVNHYNEFETKVCDSWCQYPKAKECIFNTDNSLTILEEQRDGKLIPVLTYKFI